MRVEYWSYDKQSWEISRCDSWTREEVDEMNRLLGWEMYREAE